jgi:hypothetical protein
MNLSLDFLIEELAPFADLGTEPPRGTETPNGILIRLARNGNEFSLQFGNDGRVTERSSADERIHLSFRALLASSQFADLGRWADSQLVLLRDQTKRETIPIVGSIAGSELEGDVTFLDEFIAGNSGQSLARTLIVLIDGPAGIGKTSLIRSLAFRRSENYRMTQRPLILHVESRGRVLQNITDLMAFSLQTLRLTVTYDQIPVLVRHGLVTLAIDGFDELGDPNGYELAWAQVNDLVQSSRGGGTLIFAGRETFISKDRIKAAIPAIDLALDRLEAFNLKSLKPAIARQWLANEGWTEETLQSDEVQPLFEEGSYALRPFFLSELARPGVQEQVAAGEIDELLSFLIDSMVRREAQKFGRDIESVTTDTQRELFVCRMMEEVARDLAENQTGSIQVETLAWLAEVVADGLVPAELTGILRNRAGVIAFLTDDERRGYKKFVHEYLYNFFLARVVISSVSGGELTKFIRRNIFGVDFLEAFSDSCRNLTLEEADKLVLSASNLIKSVGDQDRARGNLAALVLSACSVVSPTEPPSITDVSLDEAYLTETVSPLHLKDVVIGQLNARAADLRAVTFEGDCSVVSLIADKGTVPSVSLPLPGILALPDKTLYAPEERIRWLHRQANGFGLFPSISIDELLGKYGPFALVTRIARYKPFWLKDGEEKTGRRILDDPHWDLVKGLLVKHGLLTERLDVPASGRRAPFYHFKNRGAMLDLETPPESVIPFLLDLFKESIALEPHNEVDDE